MTLVISVVFCLRKSSNEIIAGEKGAGEMSAETHMAAGFVIQLIDSVPHVLLIKSSYQDPGWAWKPPSATNTDYEDEIPVDTFKRAVQDESGLMVVRWSQLQGATERLKANPRLKRAAHVKTWFMVLEWTGDLRQEEILEEKSVLGVPEWVPVEEALDKEGRRRIAGTHKKALRLAVQAWRNS